ncbi:hypothetical protein K7472_19860 [Streptomyces sp. PTM05]|uniref:Uncharacterized protein n=1 Tax=Streptantibioticus parmotrematis TaxID=2873249 RepID=A0ABS7QXJ7_9ACTN|nr:hypothetical protein [Streptantibioticus parmotrematis]MBY8887085.1 hypothetical protein [Streptantibioticus parmotrematis]
MSRSHAVPTARVLRLAEDRGFGQPVTTVAVQPFKVPEVVGGCLTLLLVVPGLVLSLPLPWPATAHLVGYGLLAAVPLVVLVTWWCGRRAERPFAPALHCFHEGLILDTQDDVEVFAWHEVLVYDWTTTSQSNQPSKTRHLKLRTREGREIRDLTYARQAEVISQLADTAEAPRAREQLENSGSVTFGDYVLSTAGLTVDGTFHPWSHLRRPHSRFLPQPRPLEIRTGPGHWKRLWIDGSTTPYGAVLLDLVGRCVDDHSVIQ